MTPNCPFCSIISDNKLGRVLAINELAIAIHDGFPISVGHVLVVPKSHVSSFFEISDDERLALLNLIDEAKRRLDQDYKPDAFNIGINDGQAAGQTVGHLHIHLIPRYKGDVLDPRGGVRWILPKKANYWSDGE